MTKEMEGRGLLSAMKDLQLKALIWTIAASTSWILTSTASAALIINVGNIDLLPNQANQQHIFQVQNTGGTAVETLGIQFNIQIDSGGALIVAPTITGVNVLMNTIFQSDNNGQAGGADTVRRWEVYTLENGVLPKPSIPTGFSTAATVTFDTTGFSSGTWNLFLTTPAGGTAYLDPATGDPLAMTLNAGTLTVVPEPVNVALGIFACLLAGCACARSRHGRGMLFRLRERRQPFRSPPS